MTSARNHKIRVLTSAGLEEPAVEDLPGILEGLKKPEGPVTWIQAEPSPAIVRALDDMGLDEVAVKSLRDGPERPRVEEFADHTYISRRAKTLPVVITCRASTEPRHNARLVVPPRENAMPWVGIRAARHWRTLPRTA